MRRLALVLMLGVGLIAPAATASAAPGPKPQTITWGKCSLKVPKDLPEAKDLECAKLKAPQDWRKPRGKQITLSISRLKARSGKPQGVVFTNPGGPGIYGIDLPYSFLYAKRDKLLDNMDVIGIDVRGTGLSTQARCSWSWGDDYGYGLDPRNPRHTKGILIGAKAAAKACQKGKGLPSRLVTTAQTVRDLDWIRANLKDSQGAAVNKIHWIGYSAGTWLGAHYAAAYPRRTGRFVLDSVVDFTSTWQRANEIDDQSFQRRFAQDFAGWAAKHNDKYGLGENAKAVVDRYEAIRSVITKRKRVKVEYKAGGWDWYFPADLDRMIVQEIYWEYQFEGLAEDLSYFSDLTGTGNAARRPGGSWKGIGSGQTATSIDINCNDTAFRGSPKQVIAAAKRSGKINPLNGYDRIFDACIFWKRPKEKLKRPGANLPPVLLINSVYDAPTPYEGAVRAHKLTKRSRLVTVKNEGDHSIYATGNECVDNIVETYVVDGVMPKDDLSCEGTPEPQQAGRQRAAQAQPLFELLRQLAQFH